MKTANYWFIPAAMYLAIASSSMAQTRAGASFNPQASYQYVSANDNGEIYAVKFATDATKVNETVYIDLANDQAIYTEYDNNKPTETYQEDNLYVYKKEGNGIRLQSINQYENEQLQEDARLIQSSGIDLGFVDKKMVENNGWLEALAQNKKKLDAVMSCVSAFQTLSSCAATGLNPIMAIPCTTGLINLIGQNFDKQNPESSAVSDAVSDKLNDIVNDYEKNPVLSGKSQELIENAKKAGKVGADVLFYVIDKTNEEYAERKESLHKIAEIIRQNNKEAEELRASQHFSGKGNIDALMVNKFNGIIQRTVSKTNAIDNQIGNLRKNMAQANFTGINTKIQALEKEKKQLRKEGEKQFNDSIDGKEMSVNWEKTDGEAYYSIQKLRFTGVRWDDSRTYPYAKLTIDFSALAKPVMIKQFDEIKKTDTYLMSISLLTQQLSKGEIIGTLIVNKNFREAGKLDFTCLWDEFTATNVVRFTKSGFRTDLNMEN